MKKNAMDNYYLKMIDNSEEFKKIFNLVNDSEINVFIVSNKKSDSFIEHFTILLKLYFKGNINVINNIGYEHNVKNMRMKNCFYLIPFDTNKYELSLEALKEYNTLNHSKHKVLIDLTNKEKTNKNIFNSDFTNFFKNKPIINLSEIYTALDYFIIKIMRKDEKNPLWVV